MALEAIILVADSTHYFGPLGHVTTFCFEEREIHRLNHILGVGPVANSRREVAIRMSCQWIHKPPKDDRGRLVVALPHTGQELRKGVD
jgi:hypothetical protein